MIVKKTPDQIDKMAAAGDILVRTLDLVAGKIRPGVTTKELDAAAERFIRSQGAAPAFKGYRGFPGSICASPNAMVVHGIPGPYKLERGDVLSVDVGVVLDGWVADAARTFPVGPVSPVAQKLLDTTAGSLFAAVPRCRAGNRLGALRADEALGRRVQFLRRDAGTDLALDECQRADEDVPRRGHLVDLLGRLPDDHSVSSRRSVASTARTWSWTSVGLRVPSTRRSRPRSS